MEGSSSIILEFLQLDTKGACFLCLQPLTGYLPGNFANGEVPTVAREVSVRSLCRHLYINVRSILLPVLGEDCPSESCDLTVVLCGKCARETEGLTQLLRQLEELQMRVDFQVHQFHRILEESQEEEWEGVKERMMAEEATVDVQIVTRLREEATKKCGAMLRRRNPVVRLERLKQEDLIPVPGDSYGDDDADTEMEMEVKVEIEESEGILASQKPERSVRDPLNQKYSKFYKTLKRGKGRRVFQCLLCQGTYSRVNGKHIAYAHPHVVFQSVKQATLTANQFSRYCHVALDTETRKMPGKKGFQCGVCRSPQLHRCRAQLYSHLIFKHYRRIKQRVIQVQGNKDILLRPSQQQTHQQKPIKWKVFRSAFAKTCDQFFLTEEESSNEIECRLCGSMIGSPKSTIHIMLVHPEKLFPRHKLEAVTEDQFKLCCDHLFQTEIQGLTRLGRGENGRLLIRCPHGNCEWQSRLNTSRYRHHLLLKHFPLLEQKLKEYQEQRIWTQPPAAVAPRAVKQEDNVSLIYNICKSFYNSVQHPQGGKRLECPLCQSTVFLKQCDARRHLILVHLPVLFQSVKQSDVSEEQFGEWCRHALKLETQQQQKPEAKEFRCGVCNVSLNSSTALRSHFAVKHYEKVKERIVLLQQKGAPVPLKVAKKKTRGSPPVFTQCPSTLALDMMCEHYHMISQSPHGRMRFECFPCQRTITGQHPNYHLMYAHPHLFFENLKAKCDTEEQFASFCLQALSLETKREMLGARWAYSCGLCDVGPMRAKSQLSHHLITKHNAEIRQRIIKLQEQQPQDKGRWDGVKTYGGPAKKPTTSSSTATAYGQEEEEECLMEWADDFPEPKIEVNGHVEDVETLIGNPLELEAEEGTAPLISLIQQEFYNETVEGVGQDETTEQVAEEVDLSLIY